MERPLLDISDILQNKNVLVLVWLSSLAAKIESKLFVAGKLFYILSNVFVICKICCLEYYLCY